MLLVRYYGHKLSDMVANEYFCIGHEGFAGEKARRLLWMMIWQSKVGPDVPEIVTDMEKNSVFLNTLRAPKSIKYKQDGKFFRVTNRIWDI